MKDAKKHIGVLEMQLVALFSKVPHLPKEARDLLVILAPWCALIFGIFGVIALFTAGIFSLFLTLATFGLAIGLLIPIIIGLIASALALWAFPGLNTGIKDGWDKLFWSQIVSVIGLILSMFAGQLSFGSIVGFAIGFYLLFEIRSHYK